MSSEECASSRSGAAEGKVRCCYSNTALITDNTEALSRQHCAGSGQSHTQYVIDCYVTRVTQSLQLHSPPIDQFCCTLSLEGRRLID
jgi:hypothetical protein